MKLIIGLGNPGPEYAKTRHNVGFMAVDHLADSCNEAWKLWGTPKNAELVQMTVAGIKVLLLKPITFMNKSGLAAVAAAHFFKVLPEDILVVHDEVDLPFGEVRLKVGGGHGGHNGLKSLISSLSSSDFSRVRIGVGRSANKNIDTADHVLAPFESGDWSAVDDMIERALGGVAAFVAGRDAFMREMNTLNQKKKD